MMKALKIGWAVVKLTLGLTSLTAVSGEAAFGEWSYVVLALVSAAQLALS